MRLKARLDRLTGRLRQPTFEAPSAHIYLPDNGRGDGPFRSQCVVVYDPDDPPRELGEGGDVAPDPVPEPPR